MAHKSTSANTNSYWLFLSCTKINIRPRGSKVHFVHTSSVEVALFPLNQDRLNTTIYRGRENFSVSHSKYVRLKVNLGEHFSLNYTYYMVAHKSRKALLGRRVYLFRVWKRRKQILFKFSLEPSYTIQNKLRTKCSQTCQRQSFELNDLKF